jgi:hypothetical protein
MVRTIILFSVLMTSLVSLAVAESSWLAPMVERYNIPAESKLNSCTTCHSGQWARNVYGQDLQDAGIADNVEAAFAATDALDSDNDGALNEAELRAGTWPGDPGDTTPVEETSWGRIKALFE